MKRKVIISYNWWKDDKTEIDLNHQSELEDSAMNRINEMMSNGYTSGELNDEISDINYRGWWSITTINVNDIIELLKD